MERPELRTARRVRADGHVIWLFAGSDRVGERAAGILSLIKTARLNALDPERYLRDVLTRITALLPVLWTAG